MRLGLLLSLLMAAAACGAPAETTGGEQCPASVDLESRVDFDVGTSSDPSFPSIAISRDAAVIGSSDALENHAWIYRRQGGAWQEEAVLAPGDPAPAGFGQRVAIDGDTAAVVGTVFVGTEGHAVVYVFTRRGGAWRQQAALDAGVDSVGQLALQGDRLVVGEPRAGVVRVFVRRAAAWRLEASLTTSDAHPFGGFGDAVAIDGDLIAVGDSRYGSAYGAAYVFERRGGAWVEQAQILPPDTVQSSSFGASVSISGRTLAIGAPGAGGAARGAAYVYERRGDAWEERAKLVPKEVEPSDQLGLWVSLDGDVLAVSAPHPYSTVGKVYVFTDASGAWEEIAVLNGGPQVAFGYGEGVSLSGDTLGVFGFIRGVTTRLLGSLYVYRIERAPCEERESTASQP